MYALTLAMALPHPARTAIQDPQPALSAFPRAWLGGACLRQLTLRGTDTLLTRVLDVVSRLGLIEAELTAHPNMLLLDMRANPLPP